MTQKKNGVRHGAESKDTARLTWLEREFRRYRESVPNVRARNIPIKLRMAVADAVREGLSTAKIRKATKISSSQLNRWQTLKSKSVEQPHAPKVLSVVSSSGERETAPKTNRPWLDIRIGNWALCIGRR